MRLHNFGLPFCLSLVGVFYEGRVFEGRRLPVSLARAGVRPFCGFTVDLCSLPKLRVHSSIPKVHTFVPIKPCSFNEGCICFSSC